MPELEVKKWNIHSKRSTGLRFFASLDNENKIKPKMAPKINFRTNLKFKLMKNIPGSFKNSSIVRNQWFQNKRKSFLNYSLDLVELDDLNVKCPRGKKFRVGKSLKQSDIIRIPSWCPSTGNKIVDLHFGALISLILVTYFQVESPNFHFSKYYI